ncbi:MAG: hypothetical protein J2P45_05870 [Candidatus Dormibacteraeota bacterium]|nr:hypothetical protein [Candidatus Dormibacteraeota bacterium]
MPGVFEGIGWASLLNQDGNWGGLLAMLLVTLGASLLPVAILSSRVPRIGRWQ